MYSRTRLVTAVQEASTQIGVRNVASSTKNSEMPSSPT